MQKKKRKETKEMSVLGVLSAILEAPFRVASNSCSREEEESGTHIDKKP